MSTLPKLTVTVRCPRCNDEMESFKLVAGRNAGRTVECWSDDLKLTVPDILVRNAAPAEPSETSAE